MSVTNIRLFGNLSVQRDQRKAIDFTNGKMQELFSYLLLHRNTRHHRESLATLLWGEYSTSQAKKCLRQTLWQLQAALNNCQPEEEHALTIEADWVGINPKADLWLDIIEFEEAFHAIQGLPPDQYEAREILALRHAAELYQGDLLTGCYEDWCLCERERLRDMHLAILQKLMVYSEVHGQFEEGISYGETILRFDHAHERTHRIMMRLRYISGDRTGALHQFRRCKEALAKELDVEPSGRTASLYQQILQDNGDPIVSRLIQPLTNLETSTACLPEILSLLQQLVNILPDLEERIRYDLQSIERNLRSPSQQNLFSLDYLLEKNDSDNKIRRSARYLKDGF